MSDPFDALDLNGLRSLDVLLRERSVTRAAKALGRSQPAVSHVLKRLREQFDDPLLVREGATLVPTPRAELIAARLRHALDELRAVVSSSVPFDPRTSERVFSLVCPNVLAPMIPRILEACAAAPKVRLLVRTGRGAAQLEHADLLLDVMPSEAAGVVAVRTGAQAQAVFLRADHPARRRWGLDQFLRWRHVIVGQSFTDETVLSRILAQRGHSRTIGVVVPSLLSAPYVVAASDMLFTGPEQLLRPLATTLGLIMRPVPVPMPTTPTAALWHERLTNDPGHRWFRGVVVDTLCAQMRRSGKSK